MMAARMAKGRATTWGMSLLRLLVLAGVGYMVWRKLDFRRAGGVLRHSAWLPIAGSVLLFWVNRFVMALKWRLILRQVGVNTPLRTLTRIMFESQLLGMLIPSGLGVDLVRLVQLGRREKDMATATGSVLADRLIAIMTLAAMSVVACVPARGLLPNRAVLVYVALAGLAVIAGILVCMGNFTFRLYARAHDAVARFVFGRDTAAHARLRQVSDRLRLKAEKIHGAFGRVVTEPALFAKILGLNVLVQINRVAEIHLLFLAVGSPVPVTLELAFVPIILLLTFLPFCPYMGLGVKEYAFMYFFGHAGVTNEIAFSVSILSHIMTLIGVVPAVFLFFCAPRPATEEDRAGR